MQAPRPRNWNSSGTSPGGRITEKFGKDNSARAHDNGFRVQASRLSKCWGTRALRKLQRLGAKMAATCHR